MVADRVASTLIDQATKDAQSVGIEKSQKDVISVLGESTKVISFLCAYSSESLALSASKYVRKSEGTAFKEGDDGTDRRTVSCGSRNHGQHLDMDALGTSEAHRIPRYPESRDPRQEEGY